MDARVIVSSGAVLLGVSLAKMESEHQSEAPCELGKRLLRHQNITVARKHHSTTNADKFIGIGSDENPHAYPDKCRFEFARSWEMMTQLRD